ncbi:MAG: acylphosphatase [Pontiellaceae bacterium]|nr:acylphosphatase [Pontiellaceae bacterium]MBN2785536.1 acylphosphatase [Pontiellaceae bacterium]
MVADAEEKRLYALFSGRVQGVGFRYSVCRIAEMYPVSGFVRNLRSGDVELVAEGKDDALSEFLGAIRNSHLKSYIIRDRTEWMAASGAFDRFGVVY